MFTNTVTARKILKRLNANFKLIEVRTKGLMNNLSNRTIY